MTRARLVFEVLTDEFTTVQDIARVLQLRGHTPMVDTVVGEQLRKLVADGVAERTGTNRYLYRRRP